MSINWFHLRAWNGSQNKAFEELCCQLAEYEKTPPGSRFTRKGTPDAGVECFILLSNGDEWGWQAKFFLVPPGASEWRQIDDSVRTALEKHPRLTRYYVCLPIDRPDPRLPGQQSFMDKWKEHVEKWNSWASEKHMYVEFEYWGEHEIFTRLSLEEHRGRYFFWFNEEKLSQKWFEAKIAEAESNAGARYSPELSVDLPIAALFDGLGRTPKFFGELTELRGSLVRALAAVSKARRPDSTATAFNNISKGINRVRALLLQTEEAGIQRIDLAGLVTATSESRDHIFECEKAVREVVENAKRTAKEQTNAERTAVSGGDGSQPDFGYLLRYLYDLSCKLGELIDFLEGSGAKLANVGALLVCGDAGTGKTHLFCDVAKQRIAVGMPTVLLLGEHFSSAEPWLQITQLLGLTGGRNELLGALEAAANARGAKALILIDGLNEGEGNDLWRKHLSGMLVALRQFPRVGLAVSVRTSYINLVIPNDLDEERLVKTTHHGFADHEYDATRTFFDHFGIERPAVPLLFPEFRNPLFLKLFCKGLKNSGLTRMPAGVHGVTDVFALFLNSVNEKLAQPDHLDFDRSQRVVQRAVEKFAEALADRQSWWLPLEQARTVLDDLHPGNGYEKSLLRHLESEGVLSKDRFWSGRDGEYEEGVRFSYQRLSDYSHARILLDRYLDPQDHAKSFKLDGPIGSLFKDEGSAWVHSGLIEALSVELPERIGMELAEVAPHCADFEPVRKGFVQSLIFRNPKATSDSTLSYVNEHVMRYRGTHDEFLDALLTIASIPGHPYNANLLHRHLMKFTLADRDAWWSIYLHGQYGCQSAVDRLVEWAWSPEAKTHIEDESIRLAAVALAWFLTTSNRYLRDRATKALVSLLTPRIAVLRQVLQMFAGVNDPYVLERLCAVAYGCAMRSQNHAAIGELAKDIFTWFFEQGAPPLNILTRDSARGVIERSVHLKTAPEDYLEKIRPPYKSEWPEVIPTKEELERFGKWREGMPDEEWGQVEIHSSVMGFGDFARYIIGTNSGMFEWTSRRLGELPRLTGKQYLENFLKSLSKKQRMAWTSLHAARRKLHELSFSEFLRNETPGASKGTRTRLEKALHRAEARFRRGLGSTKRKIYEESVAPYLNNPRRDIDEDRFNLNLAQRWILAKVFDLGWTTDRFGKFDREVNRYRYGREAKKRERIGKKYQWIAYYEFLARVADNFEFRKESWSQETASFEGPWQVLTRDIDPSQLLAKTCEEGSRSHTQTWWFPASYDKWDAEPHEADWLRSTADLPSVEPLLEVERSSDHSRWLVMESLYGWEQSISPEEERLETKRREIWYMFKSYVVRADELDLMLSWAAKQNFMGRWMPESHELYRVLLGEFHWAPAYAFHNKPYYGQEGWTRGSENKMPAHILPTTNRYLGESSTFDCSLDDTIHIYLPCKWLADGMELQWAASEGEFLGRDGTLTALDPSVREAGPGALLIRKDRLLEFLNQNGYAVFWTLLGEKQSIGGWDPQNWKGRLTINGVYSVKDGAIFGNRWTTFESPN